MPDHTTVSVHKHPNRPLCPNFAKIRARPNGLEKERRPVLGVFRRLYFKQTVFEMRQLNGNTKFNWIKTVIVHLQCAANRTTFAVIPANALHQFVGCAVSTNTLEVLVLDRLLAVICQQRLNNFHFYTAAFSRAMSLSQATD